MNEPMSVEIVEGDRTYRHETWSPELVEDYEVGFSQDQNGHEWELESISDVTPDGTRVLTWQRIEPEVVVE